MKREIFTLNGFKASLLDSEDWHLGSCDCPPIGLEAEDMDRYLAFFEGLVGRLKELQGRDRK